MLFRGSTQLEMVVQWCHAEDPSADTIGSLRGFEHPHLNDHGKGFRQEDPAHHKQRPETVAQEGYGTEGCPHRQGAGVSHEHAGRVAVMGEKADPCPCHGHAKPRQGRITVVASQHQLQPHAAEHQGPASSRQAIKAIGEIGGVAFREKDEQS